MSRKRWALFRYAKLIEETRSQITDSASTKAKNDRGSFASGGAIEIDCSQGNYFTVNTNGDSIIYFSNIPEGVYTVTIEVTLGALGAINWGTPSGTDANYRWNGGDAPDASTEKTHLFMFLTDDQGATIRGSALLDYDN